MNASRGFGDWRTAVWALNTLLFPGPCALCDQPLGALSIHGICPACWAACRPLRGLRCRRCDLPGLDSTDPRACPDCRRRGVAARRLPIRAAMNYEDVVVRLHRRVKFDDARELIAPLAARMSACWVHRGAAAVDSVVPVPADPLRWQPRRGLSRRLAFSIARDLDLPMVRALRKLRSTRPQTRLTGAAREDALRDAFSASTALVQGRSVLLVDDVVTTGATLTACSEALYRAGAARVWGLALARTQFARLESAV